MFVFPAFLLAAATATSAAPAARPAPVSAQASPRPVTCTFSNPAYSGYCRVSASAGDGESAADVCQEVLSCLNNVQCTKTYCNATQVRGGWELVSAAEGSGN